ncbi:MAG: T9SS type A sorting domain-containing protein [Saprospiraceae bacterium]
MKIFNLTGLLLTCLFTISLSSQDQYEPNDSYLEATEVFCGDSYNGFIQTQEDYDWYKITTNSPGQLKVDVTSVPSGLDLNLEIHTLKDGLLTLIADDDDDNSGGGQELSTVAFIEPGEYFIVLSDEDDNSFDDSDSYSISFSCFQNDTEINQTVDLAYTISQDTCLDNRIFGENACFFDFDDGDNDRDWFKVDIDSSCLFKMDLTSVPSILDLNMEVYQIENGQLVLVADDGDDNSGGGQELSATFSAAVGSYYIFIEDEDNNATSEETYELCISCNVIVSTANLGKNNTISILPNPSDGIFHLKGLSTNTKINIHDSYGQLISSVEEEKNQLDLRSFPGGVYYLVFKNDYKVETKKIFIK